MVQTWIHGIDMNLGLDMDSWQRHGLMVLAKIHGMDIDLLTTPMVLT